MVRILPFKGVEDKHFFQFETIGKREIKTLSPVTRQFDRKKKRKRKASFNFITMHCKLLSNNCCIFVDF